MGECMFAELKGICCAVMPSGLEMGPGGSQVRSLNPLCLTSSSWWCDDHLYQPTVSADWTLFTLPNSLNLFSIRIHPSNHYHTAYPLRAADGWSKGCQTHGHKRDNRSLSHSHLPINLSLDCGKKPRLNQGRMMIYGVKGFKAKLG